LSQRKKSGKQHDLQSKPQPENRQWQPKPRLNLKYPIIVVIILLLSTTVLFLLLKGEGRDKSVRRAIDESLRQNRFAEAEAGYLKLAEMKSVRLSPDDRLDWARTALRADHPSVAAKLLQEWTEKSPDKPDGWVILLDLLRVLGQSDRIIEAFDQIHLNEIARRSPEVLMTVTLGLLTDLEPQQIRQRLKRWAAAEPDSPISQAALLQRYNENPLPDDPSRDERLQLAISLVGRFPEHIDCRAVLVETMLTTGLYEEAGKYLNQWPDHGRQSISYHRLYGRYLQDGLQDQQNAIDSFQIVLQKAPYDWKTRYRLARAFRATGDIGRSQAESARMLEIREILEPARLEPIIRNTFPKGKSPEPVKLIEILEKIGLKQFSDGWKTWLKDQSQFQLRKT